MKTLRTGIIGIGGYGSVLLAALAKDPVFVVVAIGDQDRDRAKAAAIDHDAVPYDDYRSLIVQENLDVLILALPSHLCGECIQLAARKGVHVLKETPLARNVPEASTWIDLMDKAGCRFQVSEQRRFAPGFLHGRRMIQDGRLGSVYLARAEAVCRRQGTFDWRGDPVLSGGGVLLEEGYHLIDQLAWCLGAPDRVYALQADRCSKQVLPPYRTEDAALVTLSFPDGAMASVCVACMTGPPVERVVYHGTEATLEVTGHTLLLYDTSGALVSQEAYDVDAVWLAGQAVREFADAVLGVTRGVAPVNTAGQHLVNVSTIEAAYLAARTQLPETPKTYGALVSPQK